MIFIPFQWQQLKAETTSIPEGALSIKDASSEAYDYLRLIQEHTGPTLQKTPVLMGHRLGKTDRYPESFSDPKKIKKYEPVKAILDKTFNQLNLNAVELDLRYFKHPETIDKIFVAHDSIPTDIKDKVRLNYLKENSFKSFLAHYHQRGYHLTGKKLYIELKSKDHFYLFHPSITDSDIHLYQEIFRELNEFLESIPKKDRKNILQNIGFASFNFYALQVLYNKMTQNQYPIIPEFNIIATTDSPLSQLFARFYGLPSFNHYLMDLMTQNDWVSGVWYDPIYMKSPISKFNAISKARKKPLGVYVSTYFSKKEVFLKKLIEQTKNGKIENFRGVIFDIWTSTKSHL